MVNLHDLYLNTVAAVLEANKLDVVNQPEGEKPAGVLWAMLPGTTKPEVIIAYSFTPTEVDFCITSRDQGRTVNHCAFYTGGIEQFLDILTKFINAGRLAAPKGKS